MRHAILLAAFVGLAVTAAAGAQPAATNPDAQARALVTRMTLPEKISVLHGIMRLRWKSVLELPQSLSV